MSGDWLGSAVSSALEEMLEKERKAEADPYQNVPEQVILPRVAVRDLERLGKGELAAEEWRERCSELGIADLRLAGAGEPAPAAAQ
jgi:hypothetical protein